MIDLHMHSKYSEDGEYTPAALVEQCARKGIRMLSVTDHNCAKANEEAAQAAAKKGLVYIPGVEIDCVWHNINFHVLGYGIDYRSSDFEALERAVADQCFDASLKRLTQTQALGFHITERNLWELSKDTYWSESWSGELFAEVLLSMPEYADHPLLRPYRPGGRRSDNPYVNFYWDYYSQGKPCYAPVNYPAMEEIIALIHRNHGAAVIAHPGVNLKGKEYLLKELLTLGFDGIEAFSSYHTPEQAGVFCRAAQENNLFITCGSDFHGKTKPSIAPGQHGCSVSYEEIARPLGRFL